MKEHIYRTLARRYGWTFDQIASMTLYQQYLALARDGESVTGRTLSFKTWAEYMKWKDKHG